MYNFVNLKTGIQIQEIERMYKISKVTQLKYPRKHPYQQLVSNAYGNIKCLWKKVFISILKLYLNETFIQRRYIEVPFKEYVLKIK